MPPSQPPSGTQSIQRAASILRAVGHAGPRGIGTSDLARTLPIERPTLHRMLMCLLAERLVSRDTRSKRFFLGRGLHELGQLSAPRYDLREICAASLTRIAARTGDTVFLVAADGPDGVVLDRRDGLNPIRSMPLNVGMRRPLGVGASGVAILMALDPAEVTRFIEDNTSRLREHDTSARRLLASLPKFRERGHAVTRGYGEPGLCGIGIPLQAEPDRPLGAISVTAASPRMTVQHRRDALAALQEEVAQITRRLRAAYG